MEAIPTLETERLRLRGFRRSDYEEYAALFAHPEVVRYLRSGTDPWDRGRSWRHLAFLVGHWHLRGIGMWAVEHRESAVFVGVTGFAAPEGWPGLELAWFLAPRWWGQGFATESAGRALKYAFDFAELREVVSYIHPDNERSIRVAERIGERLLRRVQHLGGEMLCFGVSRES